MAVKKGLLAVEWIAMGYLLLTLLMMAVLWDKLVSPEQMIKGRITFVLVTLAAWGVYWLKPCRLTMFLRIAVQMVFLSWWYPDTYELNRTLPNLDHVFAGCEQTVFGCQPALLFAQKAPWGWFSELMCMGYISYFPMMTILLIYYFFYRYNEFLKAAFVLLGPEKIAAGVFPNLGDWFLTHSERMAVPGWTDGFFYHLLEMAHNAGERPTAAFPSSHVGITTVVMLLAHHTHCRKLVLGMLPFYILMCLSTVYILAHYAIDALTGLFTGVVLYFVLIRLSKRFT